MTLNAPVLSQRISRTFLSSSAMRSREDSAPANSRDRSRRSIMREPHRNSRSCFSAPSISLTSTLHRAHECGVGDRRLEGRVPISRRRADHFFHATTDTDIRSWWSFETDSPLRPERSEHLSCLIAVRKRDGARLSPAWPRPPSFGQRPEPGRRCPDFESVAHSHRLAAPAARLD
jgi:hypothetical protein